MSALVAPSWLSGMAQIVGALTVVFGGLLVVIRTRPMRWFGQQVMDEFAEKLGDVIAKDIALHHDQNVAPRFDKIEQRIELAVAEANAERAKLRAERTDDADHVVRIDAKVVVLDRRVTQVEALIPPQGDRRHA